MNEAAREILALQNYKHAVTMKIARSNKTKSCFNVCKHSLLWP